MTTQDLNIVNALQTAKEVLTKMLSQGLSDSKFMFGLSNMLSEKYNLTQNQSIVIIEEALKIA
ncbi:hypothetical protein Danklef1_62 [Polaribacter phage Danklef_1]|uniref:Uncharacterized protein n=1 Tax=Polaribacter phage Danklef_1 TaxID=2745646 RepID=A0A8E4ZCG9_9CAUD|nr:hypothetical protein M1M23_gp62 [Polaribacter phage Danklef_1]QQV90622.1 hypothetical protein Danklef2_62 [Polaribacter phage Danklef_2]QQV90699.1 hypothetical protein Danklef3_63 [Polaribacter phage Danklef_3]QQV90776.1 hypothetical protein Danklef4_63 [Polaribacter phage Danklef_4]QQV90854.1 hypothetical protein Danklef5_64 [Polaribacter phage Danklef_5]QQV90546.1 hypothetical protein Danklef1_62 [Polaribacter phage Danklef_1]